MVSHEAATTTILLLLHVLCAYSLERWLLLLGESANVTKVSPALDTLGFFSALMAHHVNIIISILFLLVLGLEHLLVRILHILLHGLDGRVLVRQLSIEVGREVVVVVLHLVHLK